MKYKILFHNSFCSQVHTFFHQFTIKNFQKKLKTSDLKQSCNEIKIIKFKHDILRSTYSGDPGLKLYLIKLVKLRNAIFKFKI